MDKNSKFEYAQTVENYLEDNKVYDLFETLLQQIVVQKPDKPIDWLIDAIQNQSNPGKSQTLFHVDTLCFII